MCLMCISEQTAIISLYSTNWLVFVTETECVYCAVRSGSLNVLQLMLACLTSPLIFPNFFYFSTASYASLTYLRTPWSRVLLEKLTGLQLVKKFPAFYGTQKFITALTSVRHLSLSWASPIQSTYPHPTSWRSILILSTLLRLVLPSGLFPFGFPTKTLYAPLSSPIRATCPAHLILLDFITEFEVQKK